MKALQVIDGRLQHARGSVELVLKGESRARAHADIMTFIDPAGMAGAKAQVYRSSIARIAREDPSLLLEPIPPRYPLARTERETWHNADTVWRNHSSWYGNWLNRLVDPTVDCVEAVEAVLAAGIHPDDATVWAEGTLLASEGWATNPEKLAIGLRNGANPDHPFGENGRERYVLHALNLVRSKMGAAGGSGAEKELRDGVQCVQMLLAAGAKELDRPDEEAQPGAINFGRKLLTAIGHLVDGGAAVMKPEMRSLVHQLMGQLVRAGADMDRACGFQEVPPVVMALRSLDIEGACKLIALGCKTDDAFIVRSNGIAGKVASLTEEAYGAGKEAFSTRVTAALMERQISVSQPTDAAASTSRAPSRRLRVV